MMPLGKAREILDVGRHHQLTAGVEPFDHERTQIRPGRVQRSRQARRARADDDDVAGRGHRVESVAANVRLRAPGSGLKADSVRILSEP